MNDAHITVSAPDSGSADIKGVIVVIPSLNPDRKLVKITKELSERGFERIVLVNDGSTEKAAQFFEQAASLSGVTVLKHGTNLGKGRALKTAFEYIINQKLDCTAVVTVDGDGQHSAEDSAGVAAHAAATGKVTLGSRDFDLPQVPKRSRAGNKFSRGLFRVVFGIRITDTQTGLRGFPVDTLPLLLKIEGERFEYETNMLLEMHRSNVAIDEIPIETLYIDSNATSHYRSFEDSYRIFKITVKFLFSRSGEAGVRK